MSDKTKGYILGAIAAASYGLNPLFALPLYKAGMDPASVLFFRYLCAVPILGVMARIRGRSLKIRRGEVLPFIVMGLLMALSSLTLFESYNRMDAGIASTLLFVYPVMVAVIMAIGFREKITRMTVICMASALGGIALLYRGGDGSALSLTGTMLVMASSLSYALYIVGVNRPALREIPTLKLTFYVLLFGMSLFVVRTGFGTNLQIVDKWYLWGNVIALAVFPTAVSLICTTSAIQYIGSTPTAILGALEPVTAVFFGVMVFGEAFTPRIASGIILIIVSVTMIVAGSNIKAYLVRFRKMFPKLPPRRARSRAGNAQDKRDE